MKQIKLTNPTNKNIKITTLDKTAYTIKPKEQINIGDESKLTLIKHIYYAKKGLILSTSLD